MKKLLFVTLLPTMLLLGVLSAEAADRHVRAGATGSATGNDWTNAYPTLPSNLTRGDTYYIATGTYPGRTFNTAESGTALITIKGATVADHGTDTGWAASMSVSAAEGGTQATFTSGLTFNTSYWVFDGVVGPVGSRTTTEYGFRMSGIAKTFFVYNLSTTIQNITLSHISATAPGADVEKGFLLTNNSTRSVHNVTVSHNLINGFSNAIWATSAGLAMNDWVTEYNIILNGASTSAWHGEDLNNNYGFLNRWTIRYNWFEGRSSGTATIVAGLNGPVGTYYIYGNVFKNQTGGDGLIVCVHDNANVRVYNNTVINSQVGGGAWLSGNSADCTLSGEAYNNILYNMHADVGSGASGITRNSNAYFSTTNTPSETNGYTASGDPFVGSASGNVNLTPSVAAALPAGLTLPTPYDRDITNALRGADGKLDRGAYETGGGGADVTPPLPPTNVLIR